MELYYFTALCTSFCCFLIIGICICRLNISKGYVRPRIKYTAIILSASVAGMQPYYAGQFPGAGTLILSMCLIWLLVDGAASWRSYRHHERPMETHIFDPETNGDEDD